MFNFTAKTKAIVAVCSAFVAIQVYGFHSMRNALEARMDLVERELRVIQSQTETEVKQISSDIEAMAQRMGVTMEELERARNLARELKAEQAVSTRRLQQEIARKAESKTVDALQQHATSRISELQQDTALKIGSVAGEVQTVRVDLDATRSELAANRREIGDVRIEVARNATELSELRRRGERNYFEFDIRKSKQMERVADIQIQLRKTDVRKQKYDVVVLVDDNKVEEKGRSVNVPIPFLVGTDRLRYEVVVNYVDKDRIRGYVSTPKDKLLAAR
jgi:chromosome segregation ATPase